MSCSNVKATRTDAAFEYNEIYMPQTLGKKASAYGLNSVDYDWGVWGHNIATMIPEEHSHNIYAKPNGRTSDYSQYCFSSEHLYNYIVDYIDDNYGHSDTVRFTIMPNDNDVVCLDTKCVARGNTKNDASPAVFNLVRRLCERFPNHIFFVADYLTTSSLPDSPLPSNAGVIMSAMNYPRTVNPTTEESVFLNRIADWQKYVNRVYIWDYINNFDDYFTPVPLFSVMQHRLQEYEKAGVKGVFLNGSGSDYTALGNVNAQVLSQILYDPDYDWKTNLREQVAILFPTAAETITDFMIDQDDYFTRQSQPLPMYDGVAKAKEIYLPADRFMDFYNALIVDRDNTHGAERAKLDELINALSLTALEIERLNGNLNGYDDQLESLMDMVDMGHDVYNESMWAVSDYVKDYSFMAGHAKAMEGRNLLKGHMLRALTPLDPDYPDISIITDGLLGMPSNYHNGNLITSANTVFAVEIPKVEGARNLRVALVQNHGYHIGLPELVELVYQGQSLGTVEPHRLKEHGGHSFVEFEIPSFVHGPMTLKLYRNQDFKTMAIEEIEAY
ncbi:MAG: DUF4838 domain-containing protein [Muribaculaceae bacterium]|nr:DUF4838 domain-containing protein [Muribaculaceae bacterium]